jgi:D-glycero-D-manno-heptose 1,7-bisphosphate phosphatase
MTKRRALFLDRDGTLIHAVHYPSRPEQIRLYAGIESELRALQEMGFCLVIITNQSGIARGYITENDLSVMHEYLTEQLALQDIHVDGIYYCPHHPEGIIPELAIECACRKPQAGMLLQAATEMHLDLEHSWFVGDILDDVEAGNRAGCHTVLVDLGTEAHPTTVLRCPNFVARDTRHALQIIRKISELEPTLDMLYCPASWRLGQTIEVDTCGASA